MTEPVRRILAVDFGDARTGLAATDWTGTITVPLPRIDSRDQAFVIKAITEVVQERDTEVVVLGMVKGTAFDHGNATLEASSIADKFWELNQNRTETSVNFG